MLRAWSVSFLKHQTAHTMKTWGWHSRHCKGLKWDHPIVIQPQRPFYQTWEYLSIRHVLCLALRGLLNLYLNMRLWEGLKPNQSLALLHTLIHVTPVLYILMNNSYSPNFLQVNLWFGDIRRWAGQHNLWCFLHTLAGQRRHFLLYDMARHLNHI